MCEENRYRKGMQWRKRNLQLRQNQMYHLWPIHKSPEIKHCLPLRPMLCQPNRYLVRNLCQLPTRREKARPIHLQWKWSNQIERFGCRASWGSFISRCQARERIPNHRRCRTRCFDHGSFSHHWYDLHERTWQDPDSSCCCRRTSCW